MIYYQPSPAKTAAVVLAGAAAAFHPAGASARGGSGAPTAQSAESAGAAVQDAIGEWQLDIELWFEGNILAFDPAETMGRLESLTGYLAEEGPLGAQAAEAADGSAALPGLALIVHGDRTVEASRTIEGSVALLQGELTVLGQIEGDAYVLDGHLSLDDGARVAGGIVVLGSGRLSVNPEATVAGETIFERAADAPIVPTAADAVESATGSGAGTVTGAQSTTGGDAVVEVRALSQQRALIERREQPNFFSRAAGNLTDAVGGLFGVALTFLISAFAGVFTVRFGGSRVETVSNTVAKEFWRSAAMGVAGQILFVPAILLLAILVVTAFAVPFFIVATLLAAGVGYLCAAHAVGTMFSSVDYRSEILQRLRGYGSVRHVLNGLGIMLLPFAAVAVLEVLGGAAPVVRGLTLAAAIAFSWLMGTAGFGAVLLTRGGSRAVVDDWAGGQAS